MQVTNSSGQAVAIDNIPQGTSVRVAGTRVQPSQDSTYPIPPNVEAELVVSRGDVELFRTQVPPTAPNTVARVRYVEATPSSAVYEPGSRDDIRNRAAKQKWTMSLFGIGAIIGVGIGVASAMRD